MNWQRYAHPILVQKVEAMLLMYPLQYKGEGLSICQPVMRTQQEQWALWAQGRMSLDEVNALRLAVHFAPITAEANKGTVTNCDGVHSKSNHQGVDYNGVLLSRAIDLAPYVLAPGTGKPFVPWEDIEKFDRIGPVARAEGLIWGGDWPPDRIDRPHVELPRSVR
ncbi:MAG: M15 family peptidase [Salinibacterium sp.]|nr:MAG: M15 family peptidase [Salinibacterium sp.]